MQRHRRNCARNGRNGGRWVHPAGTKLVRRFIRDAVGENESYRRDYTARTGREA